VQVYPELCWVVLCLMFEENTNRGRAVSGSNRSFIEIQVVGVDLAKPSSILAGRIATDAIAAKVKQEFAVKARAKKEAKPVPKAKKAA
jgi:hypothetical protein